MNTTAEQAQGLEKQGILRLSPMGKVYYDTWGKLSPRQIACIVRRRVIFTLIMRNRGITQVNPQYFLSALKAVLEHIK